MAAPSFHAGVGIRLPDDVPGCCPLGWPRRLRRCGSAPVPPSPSRICTWWCAVRLAGLHCHEGVEPSRCPPRARKGAGDRRPTVCARLRNGYLLHIVCSPSGQEVSLSPQVRRSASVQEVGLPVRTLDPYVKLADL